MFSLEFIAYVNELQRGLARVRLAPERFARLYTLRELDLMLIIDAHEKGEESRKTERLWSSLWQKNQS